MTTLSCFSASYENITTHVCHLDALLLILTGYHTSASSPDPTPKFSNMLPPSTQHYSPPLYTTLSEVVPEARQRDRSEKKRYREGRAANRKHISYHRGQRKLNPVGKLWEIVSNTCLNIIPLEGEGSWGTYTPIPVIHWKGCSWGSLFLPAVHMGRSEVTFQKKSSGSEMQILQLEACWSTMKWQGLRIRTVVCC